MLNSIALPFAGQLVEDRLEVRRWMETLPGSPSDSSRHLANRQDVLPILCRVLTLPGFK